MIHDMGMIEKGLKYKSRLETTQAGELNAIMRENSLLM